MFYLLFNYKGMKNLFIGIDFSKKKFDATVLDRKGKSGTGVHAEFENNAKGSIALVQWVGQQTRRPRAEWLFVGEHTGLYSVELSSYLVQHSFSLWLENPLQIKRSMGIQRGKNDKADSRMIALYGCRFEDKARLYRLPEASLQALAVFLSFRARLIRDKQSLLVSAAELRAVKGSDSAAGFVYEESLEEIASLNKRIQSVEAKMQAEIERSAALKENYDLATSVKGIGPINAIFIITYTQNFTSFGNSRQFACYSGVAPFERSSGTSINGGSHVSPLANKTVKALLSCAACCAVKHDPELKCYYERKRAEGKPEAVILNNVKNKMLHRLFAVVRKKQRYQTDYVNKLKLVA
jgi:transposase